MRRLPLIVWTFVLLMLLVFSMILFSNQNLIGFSFIVFPLLVAYQTYRILRSEAPNDQKLSEGEWYEHK